MVYLFKKLSVFSIVAQCLPLVRHLILSRSRVVIPALSEALGWSLAALRPERLRPLCRRSAYFSPALYQALKPRCSYLLRDNGAAKHPNMALHVPKAPGFAQMLKDGAKVRLEWRYDRF